jgi:hypothetical protein
MCIVESVEVLAARTQSAFLSLSLSLLAQRLQVARNYRLRGRFQLKNRFMRGIALHLKGLFVLPRGLFGSNSYLTTGTPAADKLTSAQTVCPSLRYCQRREEGKLLIPKFASHSNAGNNY